MAISQYEIIMHGLLTYISLLFFHSSGPMQPPTLLLIEPHLDKPFASILNA